MSRDGARRPTCGKADRIDGTRFTRVTGLLRILAIIPCACLLAGCWTPGPGQLDPTLYPWHPRNKLAAAASAPNPHPHPRIVARGLIEPSKEWAAETEPPQGTYCMMSLETPGSGIIANGGANAGIMTCSVPANPAPVPD